MPYLESLLLAGDTWGKFCCNCLQLDFFIPPKLPQKATDLMEIIGNNAD